uniref:Uncharacterized protein n=1 Tax=Chelonoidis abingdonii TaxID=106734 RepID=A0A8C0G770_CHEAB
LAKPSLIISTNEAVITMKTESSFKSTKISKLGEVLEETLTKDKKTEVRPDAFLQSQSTNMGGGGSSFPTPSTTSFHVIGLQTSHLLAFLKHFTQLQQNRLPLLTV